MKAADGVIAIALLSALALSVFSDGFRLPDQGAFATASDGLDEE